MSVNLTCNHVHRELLTNKVDALLLTPDEKNDATKYLTRYEEYVNALLIAWNAKDFKSMAKELDDYLNFAKVVEANEPTFGDKSKYYSSILEEMPVVIAKVILEEQLGSIGTTRKIDFFLGGTDCLIRVGASPTGELFYEKKRIDFCFAIKSTELDGFVPLVGYEMKKYLDKVMFGTVLETYKSLQVFRPRTVYGVMAEDEARREDVVRNSPMFASEFILTGCRRKNSKRNPVDAECLQRFLTQMIGEIKHSIVTVI